MNKNVLQMFEKAAELYPEKNAFSDYNGSLSYEESVYKAKAIGTHLAKMNVRNRAVAILQEKERMALVSFMGVVYSGNFYVPIDSKMPDERIRKIFDIVSPCAVLCDEANYERARKLVKDEKVILATDAMQESIDEEMLGFIRKKAIDTDPVYALFTSGSTGVPKGVVCCHRSVIDYADWLIDTFNFDENTVFGNQTQFYFSMSVLDIYATIRSGAELHIIPQELFTFPIKLLEYMNQVKVNTVYWVPTALCVVANLRALDKIEMPYLKKILFAGEAMPNKQLNIWRKHLPDVLYANLFGPTEITDIGIYYIVNREFADDEPLPIGNTCDNVDALILDESGKEVGQGEMGELCIRGSFLGLGYYDNPEKTAEVFIQNPCNPHYPEMIYKTGDLVSINSFGEFMYHGRKDFQIKHRGNRIELGEIETAIGGIDGVESSVCIYDEKKSRILCFYVGTQVPEENLLAELEKKVPEYMIPNQIFQLAYLPNNANGKIDRKHLKEVYINGKIDQYRSIL